MQRKPKLRYDGAPPPLPYLPPPQAPLPAALPYGAGVPVPHIGPSGALVEQREKRHRGVSLRMTPSEYERIRAAARLSGFATHSEWIRAVILGSVVRVESGELQQQLQRQRMG